jgi:transposase-like protein
MCTKCGRKITPNDGFLRMRYAPDDIKTALKVAKQMSLREASKELRKRGIDVSHQAIAKWKIKYKKLLRN